MRVRARSNPSSCAQRRIVIACICLCTLYFVAPALAEGPSQAAEIDATALLERAFRNLYGDDYVQTMSMSTRAKGGNAMTRSLQITRRQSAGPGKALVRFTHPPEIRRTSILILENRNSSDDLYVYLPALRRTKHLSSSQRADAFFGTDFSYEDVEPKRAEDYLAEFSGLGTHAGQPCALIEIRSKPEIESAYEKMLSCIEPERGIIVWTDFYQKGSVTKRLEIDMRDVRIVADRFIPFSMTMRTPRTHSETLSVTQRYELRSDIPDQIFNTWNLEAGSAKRDRTRSSSATDEASEAKPIPAPTKPIKGL